MPASPSPRLAPLGRLLGLLLALGAVLDAACAEPVVKPCERNSDCSLAYCLDGVCRQDCVDSALDCPRGYACSAIGKCEFEGAGGMSQGGAAGSSGGPSGASGQGGKAGATAGAAGQVAGTSGTSGQGGTSPAGQAGQTAAGQSGAAPGGQAGQSGADPGGQGGAGAGQAGASAGGDPTGGGGSPFGGGGAGAGQGIELDPCLTDGDCATGLFCRADFKNGPRTCTRSCGSNADCLGGRRCEQIEDTKVCVQGDVGRACSAPETCNFGCLLGPKYCTTPCTTGADCPNGYGCAPIGTPPTSVCVKLAAACDPQDTSACIVPAACDTSLSLLVAGCTSPCTTAADCPQRAAGLPPWTCDGLCRRPADVLGPLEGGSTPTQYACNASSQPVNLCNDGQHIDFGAFTIPPAPAVDCSNPITTSGQPTDSCLDSCRYQGGCPWGFTCTAVGNVNNARIGLCLLDGQKPVGAPCSSGTECSYGYCLTTGTCSRDCTADGLCPTGSTCTAAGGPTAEGKPFRRCQ